MKTVKLTLTRRNLLALLDKLDHNRNGGAVPSACTIIKRDTEHKQYPLTGCDEVYVQAVEDEEYYTDRSAGVMLDNKTGGIK